MADNGGRQIGDVVGADVSPGRRSPVGFDVPTGTPLKVAYTPELAVLGSWQ